MKALLKDGKTWVEIDASCLFNNQYNTTNGKRIFDEDIIAIRDDNRRNMGKCRYCGALVRHGEEEKHFQEREAHTCAGCFWRRERAKSKQTTTGVKMKGGKRVTVKTTVEELEDVCGYGEPSGYKADCTFKECRQYGIEWFTPENTFFLAFPDGLPIIPDIAHFEEAGFIFAGDRFNGEYKKKIGSYTLKACPVYEDGKPTGVKYFMLSNCRRSFIFRIENGKIYTNKYSFGFYRVKTLEGVPAAVMAKVKELCNHEGGRENVA